MAYNTGNAVPSRDPRDLLDNAESFDIRAASRDVRSTPDRLGVPRKTWYGMEQDFAEFLAASGFEPAHLTYQDGVALQVDRPTQLIDRSGSVYRVKMPASFPVTLTGTWAADSALLVDVGDESLRQQLTGPDGAKMIGGGIADIANVAALRSYSGKSDEQRVRLAQYDAEPGIGAGVFRRATGVSPADNGVTVFVAPGNIRWIREDAVGPIDVRWAGAVPAQAYSPAMVDSKDAVARAQAAAGVDGVVHFPLPHGWTEAHYLLNATGINLSGSLISADRGVVIHAPFTSDNEEQKPRLLGDVMFSELAPVGTNDYRQLRGSNTPPVISAISAAISASMGTNLNEEVIFPFDAHARAIRISDLTTSAFALDSNGMSISDLQAYWTDPTAAGAGNQGLEFAAAAGAEVECLLHNQSSGGSSGTILIGVRTVSAAGASAPACYYRFTIGGSTFSIYRGAGLLKTVTIQHPADQIGGNHGAVRAAIRVGRGSRFIQLILNGQNYGEFGLGSAIAQSIFFVADQSARTTLRLKYPVAKCRDTLVSPRPLKICALGDSITRGARTSNEWPQLVRDYASHLPGIGEVTVTNLAVSGISARTIANNIASYDFSPYDYVLVMLGTNDCQNNGAAGVGNYFSDIVTIGQAIAGAEAKPVFGVFPRFTSATVTGNGNNTSNMEHISHYQQIVRQRVLNAGWMLADPDDFFGSNYGLAGSFDSGLSTSWYHDNIHPNTKGSIAVAAAFAAALSRAIVVPVQGCFVSMLKPKGTFAANSEPQFGMLRVIRQGNICHIHGAVSGGASSQIIAALPAWARPAGYHCAPVFARTAGSQVLASIEIRNNGDIVSGIAWGTERADLTASYHV